MGLIKWCLNQEAAGFRLIVSRIGARKSALAFSSRKAAQRYFLFGLPANTASPAWKFRKPDHLALADSTHNTFVMPFTLAGGSPGRPQACAAAACCWARLPAEPAPGQRLPPRLVAAPIALGIGHPLRPRLVACVCCAWVRAAASAAARCCPCCAWARAAASTAAPATNDYILLRSPLL
jgi:hypothetical protein